MYNNKIILIHIVIRPVVNACKCILTEFNFTKGEVTLPPISWWLCYKLSCECT